MVPSDRIWERHSTWCVGWCVPRSKPYFLDNAVENTRTSKNVKVEKAETIHRNQNMYVNFINVVGHFNKGVHGDSLLLSDSWPLEQMQEGVRCNFQHLRLQLDCDPNFLSLLSLHTQCFLYHWRFCVVLCSDKRNMVIILDLCRVELNSCKVSVYLNPLIYCFRADRSNFLIRKGSKVTSEIYP